MPKFSFDPIRHIYTVDDRELVSVTQCLPKSEFMSMDDDGPRVKGNYVHEVVRLYLLNDLNEDTLDGALIPYLDALKKFLSDSKGMQIQGVIDIKSGAKTPTVELQIAAYIELVNNGKSLSGFFDYAELKNNLILEQPFFHPLYNYCGTPDIVIGDYPVKEGHALYLKNNGKYKLETIPNVRRNLEMFLQFLNTEKWCREHNLKGKD